MKIFRPGMAPVYVDEPAPPSETAEKNPLPSVEAAIAAANARQAQILNYTRSPPLKKPEDDLTTSPGQRTPHSVNTTPEVQK